MILFIINQIKIKLNFMDNKSIKYKTAIFPVAGFGSRFLPATKASPKEMLPIIDKPLIQYSVEMPIIRVFVILFLSLEETKDQSKTILMIIQN